ncbi:MAG: twin-arginine translocase TatA/TatE family subunit [Acidobacteriota bacterium]|nr:twin-arginine translocase TatA/TatE family subunit [Acidobacteriota bacterium]
MPSFGDSAFIFILALLLFGPKKLPELARQLGKLMAEFRRASPEFRVQMEEELRLADQAEQQKKLAALQAAAPQSPALETPAAPAEAAESSSPLAPAEEIALPAAEVAETYPDPRASNPPAAAPIAIATEGELSILPPATGLPTARGSAPTDEIALAQRPERHTQDPESPVEAPKQHA